MNTVSMKVNVPSSREIMGSAKNNQKTETPVDYEQAMDGVSLSSDVASAVCVTLAILVGLKACQDSGR